MTDEVVGLALWPPSLGSYPQPQSRGLCDGGWLVGCKRESELEPVGHVEEDSAVGLMLDQNRGV